MAIIGSAEVEVRANVRKLGKDITDSFDGLEKQADQIADRMGKSIAASLKDSLDGLTIRVDIDQDHLLDQMVMVEDAFKDLDGAKITIDDDHLVREITSAEELIRGLSDEEVNVDVSADTGSLASLTRAVKNIVDSLPEDSKRVEVNPEISAAGATNLSNNLRSAIDQARELAESYGIEVSVDPTSDELTQKLNELISYAEDQADEIGIGIALSQQDIEEINAAIQAMKSYNEADDIDIGVDVQIAAAMAQLALLTRKRFVDIVPKINNAAAAAAFGTLAGFTGFNIMREHTEDFIRSLTELDKALPGLASQLALLSAAVPTAGFVGGWATMLIGDIGTLSGLVVPLAGILGGAAIAGGTLALALGGTGDRLKDLNPRFEAFRDAISSTYWGEAEKPFRNMIDKVLPPLQKELNYTSEALGRTSSALFDAITNIALSESGAGAFSEVIANTNNALEKLGPAFEPFLRGLLNLSAIGSQYLPGISDWIVKIGEGFEEWSTNTAEIEEWADNAIEVMKSLFSIVGSTVGILRTLYGVAQTAGFPGIRELATGLENINAALKTDSSIETLTQLAGYIKAAFGDIADSLGWVGPLIMDNMDGILRTIESMGSIAGGILDGIGNALTNTGIVDSFFNIFESMDTAVQQFQPAFESIGTIIAVTLDFLGSALTNITPILTQFFENLAQDAILIKPAFMGMLDIIGVWGPQVMEVVGTVTNAVAEWFGKLDPIIALAGLAFVAFAPIVATVGGVILGAISWVGRFADDIGKLALAVGKAGGPMGLFQSVVGGLSRVFPMLTRAISVLTGPIGWIVGAFVSAFVASEDLRRAVGDFLVNAFITLAAFVQPLIGPIGQLFGVLMDGLSQIGAAVAPAFTGLFNALNSVMPIIQLVASLLGQFLGGAIRNLSVVLESLFNTVSTVFGGLANIVGGAFNVISSVITGLIDAVKGLVSGDMSAVGDAFKGMLDGILEGLLQMGSGVVQAIGGLFTGAIDLALSSIKGLLTGLLSVLQGFDISQAGQDIIQSLIDGFTAAVDYVREWLQNLTELIISWKGPPSKDATLLNDAGRSIIQSLIDGFVSAVQGVMDFLVGLTQQILDVVMNIVNGVVGFFQSGWNILVTVVQTVWNAIVTVITTVFNLIITGIQTYINLVVTIFQTGWSILTTVVSTVWNFIVTIIQTVWTTIVTVIQTYITMVATVFQTGWSILTTIVSTVWNAIVTIIQTVWAVIQGAVNLGLGLIRTAFSTVWNAIVGIVRVVWNTIMVVVRTAITAVQTVISTVMNVIRTVISTVWNAIRGTVTTVVNTIRSVITSVFNAIRSVISSIMNTVRSVISSVWNSIRSTVTSVVNNVRSAVTSAFNTVRSTISNVMNSVRSTISSVWNSVRSTVSSAVNNVRSTVSNAFNALRGIVSNAWNAVVSAVRGATSNMMGIVRGIPGQIRGALGNLGSLLTGAGRSIIQGLINGVTGMIGTLKSKFSSITNMIPDWKGPPDTDAKLLTNAGELIMEGLISGLESKYGAVKNSLQTFTGDLSQTVGTTIGADVGLTTSVRNTALSDAERRLTYRANADSMVQSNSGEREIHIHIHQPLVNPEEVIMAVNRELGRGY